MSPGPWTTTDREGVWPFSDGELHAATDALSDALSARGVTLGDAVSRTPTMIAALHDLAAKACERQDPALCLCPPCLARENLRTP